MGVPVSLIVNSKIDNHAFGDKKLLAVALDQVSILLQGDFPWYGKHDPPGKLGTPLFLYGFGRIPQGVAVGVLRRGVGRQHNFCADDPSFLRIAFLFLVVPGKQPFATLISCGGYG